ncbi:MAG: DEAD/DEAH box helicase [Actinobacteria bacterium]|nr:DEAD/DEAH box helicase [Actinomycetota bacterium]
MSRPTFSDLGVSAPVAATLADRQILHPFPIQELVLPDAMAGRDVLARSRTGSGKTLAFVLPIIERIDPTARQPGALILVPTRELASQVTQEFVDVARVRGLRVASVYGGVGIREQGRAAGRAHILVATPGRMEDIANRGLVRLDAIRIFVLDEADRMLDMGFQPQVDRLVRRLPKDRQTMFFSATLDGEVGRLAHAYTRSARRYEVEAAHQTVEEVEHRFVPVAAGGKVEALVALLRADRGLALVFVRTKRGADRLASKLRAHDVRAVAMHGDLTQAAREQALSRFESGRVDTLVATDVAARGLDLERISHVINFDPPQDDKGYVHRVGRTARAGRAGTGVTFVHPEEQGDVGRMASRLKLGEEFQLEGMVMAPPRLVFTSGRRGGMRGRARRR